jgi:NADH dehydrogenase
VVDPPDTGPLGRIAITGANGHLGRALIRRLLGGGGAGVRALVRSERAASQVRAMPRPPDVVVVDYGDAEALARRLEGCDAVVHLVGILKEAPGTRYVDAHEGTARALAAAAKEAGFRRVAYLSILGTRADAANACLASKGRAEEILLESPLATTVLRVPMVLGGDDPASAALCSRARARVVLLVRGGASLEQPIDSDDVVGAVCAALARPALAGRVLDLAGPESLSRAALVRRAGALVGNRPVVLPLPFGPVRLLARLAERLLPNPPVTATMLEVLEHDDRVDPEPACRALGIGLTPLDETLRRCLQGAADRGAS